MSISPIVHAVSANEDGNIIVPVDRPSLSRPSGIPTDRSHAPVRNMPRKKRFASMLELPKLYVSRNVIAWKVSISKVIQTHNTLTRLAQDIHRTMSQFATPDQIFIRPSQRAILLIMQIVASVDIEQIIEALKRNVFASCNAWTDMLTRLIYPRRKHGIRARVNHLIAFFAQHGNGDQGLVGFRNTQHLFQRQNTRIAHIVYAMKINVAGSNGFHHSTFLGYMHSYRGRCKILEIRWDRMNVTISTSVDAPLGLEH